mmetsp:Transcript_24737/g.58079  ORF Transcript_24737/g.58079 Transcript_24737/m.58079 type:complete len:379 (-) Transcript_24737:67-1203(-)
MIRDFSNFFFAVKATVVFLVFYNHCKAKAFETTTHSLTSSRLRWYESNRNPLTFLNKNKNNNVLFAGMGMGMGATKSKKRKGGKNKNKGKASSSTPFDVSASLIRLEKKYDQLMLDFAKELKKEEADSYSSYSSGELEMMTSEYVIAARASSQTGSVPDWVPIAQLCLKRPETEYSEGASDAMVQTAISVYCRELSHLAAVGAPVFSTIARNDLQYSVESIDSFHKFVYDEVVEGKATKNPDQTMTKAEARETLGLLKENGSISDITKTDIKQAYRKLSFELHPDRFEGTPEQCKEATSQFGRVKLAYDTLSSGVREEGVSWYESLGGKERTGFVGPVNLLPIGAAQENMTRHKAEGALCGFDPELVQSFVARHLRSA